MRILRPVGLLLFVLGITLLSAHAQEMAETLSVEEILDRALERSAWYRAHEIERRLSSRVLRTSQELDDQGDVEEVDKRLYEVFPIGKYPFERLIEKDGEPLTNKELLEQQEREFEFREKVAAGENPMEEEEERGSKAST